MSTADVCLILEGTYPYVTGGVSHWTHELIQDQSHLSFHLVAVVAAEAKLDLKYTLPSNVTGVTIVRLQDMPEGDICPAPVARNIHNAIKEPLFDLLKGGNLSFDGMKEIINGLQRFGKMSLGASTLLDRREAWDQMLELYGRTFEDHSFLDFFWSYRAIVGGLFSVLLADLPKAKVYHALSTGYAGLYAARAKIETGRPCMVTEHGIYTNERRVELATADWLHQTSLKALTIDKTRRELRDMWVDAIFNFSSLCYEACDEIVTLFKGNQDAQLDDGADPARTKIIPNGVDVERFGRIQRHKQALPTFGLIGRVVPIKDIKNFIRACALFKQEVPEFAAYVIGPTDEDETYYEECVEMAEGLGLKNQLTFTGMQRVDDYLEKLDVLVLSSLSEAQPLVILEAGAAGVPTISTDVGACSELLYGQPNNPSDTGEGGIICPLANPAAIAASIRNLLSNEERYVACSEVMRKRVNTFYTKELQHKAYHDLYEQLIAA